MIHESIIRNLILEEMKRDPLFRQYAVNEGLGDLWKAITKRVSSSEAPTLESIFTDAVGQFEKIKAFLTKIIKKIAGSASTKSEHVVSKRVNYLLNNLNEGPGQLNEVALIALLAAAKIGAIKWGATMGWVKVTQWVRMLAQWVAKKMGKIPDDEYSDLTDDILRTEKGAEKDSHKMHHVHHTLDEQADSNIKALAFFARWKRVEHLIEKIMDAPFKGIATMLTYIFGGDPKGNDKASTEDIAKYIKTLFLLLLLAEAINHAAHIFKHLKHSGIKEILTSIKHIMIESEEASAAVETEGKTAAEGLITAYTLISKEKVAKMVKILKDWKSLQDIFAKDISKELDVARGQKMDAVSQSVHESRRRNVRKTNAKKTNTIRRRIR